MKLTAGMTAVITGAASGIGLALAHNAADRGLNVVMADRDQRRLDQATATVGKTDRVIGVVTDVTDPGSVEVLAEVAESTFGPVHLLANNAGILRPGSAAGTSLEDFQAVFAVNIFGIVHAYHAFVPRMLAHGQQCHVLNTASLGGLYAARGATPYTVSKHAAVGLSEILAAEMAGSFLGVTILCPGGVATDIFAAEQRRRKETGVTAPAAIEERFARIADPERSDLIEPSQAATVALDAVEAGELYAMVFPPTSREAVRRRLAAIERAIGMDEARS